MKTKQIACGIALVYLTTGLGGCAIKTMEGAKARSVSIDQITAAEETQIKEWISGKDGDWIVFFKKGESVKLKLEGNAGFAQIDAGENKVKFLQDVYLCINLSKGKNSLMISPDGVRFAPLHDAKAIKKLFGKKRGYFSLGFGITKEEGPVINMGGGWQ